MPYLIRKLTRDPHQSASASAATGDDIDAVELRLSSEEIEQRLEQRQLRSTDLVMVWGAWTTLADSVPFSELSEPYARSESRTRTLKGALTLLALASVVGLFFVHHFFFPGCRCH